MSGWGAFSDGSDLKSELQASDFISPKQKLEKLKLSNMTTTTTNGSNQVLVTSLFDLNFDSI